MAEKPILFNTEMVKAILDGRKTQTRRLVKGIPLHSPYFEVVDGAPMVCDDNGDWYPATAFSRIQSGDVLWVRETWAKDVGRYMYRANYSDTEKFFRNGREIKMIWHPSIHMPREAARLFLRVKDVRTEKLQHISREDAIAEGCNAAIPIFEFKAIWGSTIRKADIPRYGWNANPWVWVIEFERMEGTSWDAIHA